jgi:tetratricopeptide (TPR) repeat protein
MVKKIAGLVIFMVTSFSFLWAQDRARIQAWSVEADTLMNRRDYEGALTLYTKIIQESKLKSEDDFMALYNRALAYFSLGRHAGALRDVNQYIEKYPEQHARLLRLYIYQELGDHENQVKDLNALIAESPGNAELIQWRMSVLMDAEKYAEARKDIRQLLTVQAGPELRQASPELRSYLGLTYYYEDNADSAMIIFDEVIKTDPSYVQSYLYAGSLCIEKEAYDLALKYVNKGLQQEPANTTLLFYKGIALVENKKIQEGCRCLTKAFNAGFDDAADYLKEYCYGIE